DYQPLTGFVVIPAGQESADVTITPIADGLAEGDETVTPTVADRPGYFVDTPEAATVTITDTPVVTVSTPDATASEETPADTGTVRFTRSGKTTEPLSVHYTLSGTATPGTDYVPLTG